MDFLLVQVNFRFLGLLTVFSVLGYGFPIKVNGQYINLTSLSELEDDVRETSGLMWINDRLVTHNDSGDEPVLYELNPETGEISRRVVVADATNVDWEDICADETHIYIGDIGNNSGSRKDLIIYKISISDYLTAPNDTVSGETIQYRYADQTDFQPTQFQTSFDAEALVSFGDSLYIFTKNWGNQQCDIYPLPKVSGDFTANKKDSIFSDGLVTGATINPLSNSLVLIGYGVGNPFMIEINTLDSGSFPKGYFQKYMLVANGSTQIEGITYVDENNYYLSAEGNFLGSATLYNLQFPLTFSRNPKNASLKIFPNPVKDVLSISSNEILRVEIYDSSGIKHEFSNDLNYHIADLSKGLYTVIVKDEKHQILAIEKIVKL